MAHLVLDSHAGPVMPRLASSWLSRPYLPLSTQVHTTAAATQEVITGV